MMAGILPETTIRGPIVVGEKTLVLRVGIAFSLLALATCIFLTMHIGAFPPLVLLNFMIVSGLGVFIYRLNRAAHVLRFDERGIDDRTQEYVGGFFAWDEFASCGQAFADGRPMLGLCLTDEARAARHFIAGAVMERQRESLGFDLLLPPEVLLVFGDLDAQIAALESYRTQPERRRELAKEGQNG